MSAIRTFVKREPVLLATALASLISMKLCAHSDHARMGRYLLEFTAANVLLLLILSLAVVVL